jgi:hypothetical protein
MASICPVCKGNELLELTKKFMKEQSILCEETIYQTDRVSVNSLEFIDSLCKVVGYSEE